MSKQETKLKTNYREVTIRVPQIVETLLTAYFNNKDPEMSLAEGIELELINFVQWEKNDFQDLCLQQLSGNPEK